MSTPTDNLSIANELSKIKIISLSHSDKNIFVMYNNTSPSPIEKLIYG